MMTLQDALPNADLRVLLMCLFQHSGDPRWLDAPYTPTRDINLIAEESAGLAPDLQAEIRAAAPAILTRMPKIPNPDPDLTLRMMRHCLGENVPDRYTTMMREEMGFASRLPAWPGPQKTPDHPIVIAGAGASGIVMAKTLHDLGLPYIVLDENAEVGGTWLVNRYPGCAVDTPNHAYSFSMGKPYPWAHYFSRRAALAAYMVAKSHEFGIRPNIRFRTRITAATWDEPSATWRIDVTGPNGPETLTAHTLISAIGPLSKPKIPAIPGLATFQGAAVHSAEWPEDLDLKGKRVAVIGTGASAMQIVPTIAPDVAHLTVFQRTPQWIRHIPRFQDAMTPGARWLLENVPFYAQWFRFTMLWRYGDGLLRTLKRDPDWPHPDRSMNRMNDRHRQQMAAYIEDVLKDRPDLLAKCMPGYPPYAKRILLDNGWYATLCRPNVTLVTDPIARITPTGVQARAHHDADVIVLATGFQVFQNAARLNVTGRHGTLADQWAGDDPKAYLGITAPGFPNFFILQGPNTVLAHGGSAIFISECQARYIAGAIMGMLDRGIAAMDVRQDTHDAYMARVDAEHRDLVWNHPGMTPWYRNPAGRVAAAIPWSLVDYRTMTDRPDFNDYHLSRA